MLASKIEDFSILQPSKRPSKFHPFSHRFFIDFGSKNCSPKSFCRPQKAVLDTNLLLKTVQEPLGLDFLGGQGSIFDGFWMIFGSSRLTLVMFSAALADMVFVVLGEVFRQLCQENPRTCRGQSRESKNLPRTKPRRKSVRTHSGKLESPSFLLPNSLPYRKGPDSENFARRYYPQGGFNPPPILGRRARSLNPGHLKPSGVLPKPTFPRFWESERLSFPLP